MRPLTARQMEVLRFLQTYIDEKKISPSLKDISEGIGLGNSGTTAAKQHLEALQKKGFVDFQIGIPRSIVILKPLEDNADNQQETSDNST